MEIHKSHFTLCTSKRGGICTHIIPKCANYRQSYQATVFRGPAKLKAQTGAWKENDKKSQAKAKQRATK